MSSSDIEELFRKRSARLTKKEHEYYMMWLFYHKTGIQVWEFADLIKRIEGRKRTPEQNQAIVDKLEEVYRRIENEKWVQMWEDRLREKKKRLYMKNNKDSK